jgi:hypothetical protein
LIEIYFDGRTGFTRLFSGALDCIGDESDLVDNVAPPMDYLVFNRYYLIFLFRI